MPFASSIISFSVKLLEKIGIGLITDKIKKTYPLFHLKLNKRKKYLVELESTIKKMPFLYDDDNADVIKDFVDIRIQNVNVENLQIIGTTSITNHSINTSLHKLKEETKVLIIGNAGIGKTTLLRHTALNLINNKATPYFNIGNQEPFLPVFISLKAIRNTKKSPILNYILTNYPLFNGPKGVKRFLAYASKRKIFLFLDGYDEIGFVTKENYIQSELAFLLSNGVWSETAANLLENDYKELYGKIKNCRVWLSTREEFYRINPLIEDIELRRKYFNSLLNNSFTALKITGLGENRLKFVKRIFDNYKEKDNIFKDLLDEEQFIEDIDTSNDETLISLSRTPLFLTIMSYLYVNNIDGTKKIVVDWLTNFEQLVKECINVMLVDLDKYKVRNLTSAQREAFKRRRNSYEIEKKEFLNYFSLCLLIDNLNVFDEDYIKNKSVDFFNKKTDQANSIKILNEYENPNSNNPNFYTQLLVSGLFTVVGVEKGVYLYDFPHRRFKEVLALESISDSENYLMFTGSITSKHLSEFVLLVLNSAHPKAENIIYLLFQHLRSEENEYINRLLNSYLENLVSIPQIAAKELELFILESVEDSKSAIFISKVIFEKIQLSPSVAYRVLELSKRNTDLISYRMCLEIVREIDMNYFKSFLLQQIKEVIKTDFSELRSQIILSLSLDEVLSGNVEFINVFNELSYYNKYFFDQFTSIGLTVKKDIEKNADLRVNLLLHILITIRLSTRHFSEDFVKSSLQYLNLVDKILLFAYMGLVNPTKYKSFKTVSKYYNYFELINLLLSSETYELFKVSSSLENIVRSDEKVYNDRFLVEQLKDFKKVEYNLLVQKIQKIQNGDYNHLKIIIG